MTHAQPPKTAQTLNSPRLPTWSALVYQALRTQDPQGNGVALQDLYGLLEKHPKTRTNPTWKATVRRTLQEHPRCECLRPGRWRAVPERGSTTPEAHAS